MMHTLVGACAIQPLPVFQRSVLSIPTLDQVFSLWSRRDSSGTTMPSHTQNTKKEALRVQSERQGCDWRTRSVELVLCLTKSNEV